MVDHLGLWNKQAFKQLYILGVWEFDTKVILETAVVNHYDVFLFELS